ncbi:Ktr system potassium uptake protein D [Bacillus canaveralius]|uniref:Ktr system potassium uptake protein D n=1 Tax=Bacillus canaveralius TaxID=1403243 RepID=A0A2N5GL03_9BACI|nr:MULTISPECIES: TrkH family potassium uptake protein [Bacillus]PLR82138.1 Ktr system potassium uptake protein D [Bacillus canaveralius]PLR83965.1 Ktr system potassium uptake protein D [Bacillus sp. V33-4]PLR97956.1 Ktr system potassium uptake protein D [Bacillus canaveralius]RSK52332.1 TrkH family potassium uptake protein [Bacillus canaveralius]
MWNKVQKRLDKITPARAIVSYYFLAVSVSVLLLSIPAVFQPGVSISFVDTVFTAVSAVSVTGLAVFDISETYSVFGIFMLMFVLQFGGIGVMTLGTFFWLLLGKKIGLRERRLIMTDHNQANLAGVVNLIKEILTIILLIELIGTLVLGLYFLKYYPTWGEAFLHGLFAAVSATTNGGFDITGASLQPFADDYFVQIINIILITLGAIGFPVLIEVKAYLFPKNNGGNFRFSLFTKLTTVTFAALLFGGTLLILIIESQHYFEGVSWHKSFFYAFFQSASTRSGGLATMDVSEFAVPTLLIMSLLMFIGASPSSVGGGIRTTTFALNILFVYHFAKGNRSIKIFKREIFEEDIIKSLAVTMLAMILCLMSLVILSITEQHHSLLEILFEICSAFGTTGLSMGITPDLSTLGKCIIMALMFIGRIGLISSLFLLGGTEKKAKYHFPKEKVIIG